MTSISERFRRRRQEPSAISGWLDDVGVDRRPVPALRPAVADAPSRPPMHEAEPQGATRAEPLPRASSPGAVEPVAPVEHATPGSRTVVGPGPRAPGLPEPASTTADVGLPRERPEPQPWVRDRTVEASLKARGATTSPRFGATAVTVDAYPFDGSAERESFQASLAGLPGVAGVELLAQLRDHASFQVEVGLGVDLLAVMHEGLSQAFDTERVRGRRMTLRLDHRAAFDGAEPASNLEAPPAPATPRRRAPARIPVQAPRVRREPIQPPRPQAPAISEPSPVPTITSLRDLDVTPELLHYVSLDHARREGVIPVAVGNGILVVATLFEDTDLSILEARFPNLRIERLLAPPAEVEAVLDRLIASHDRS